MPKFSIYKDLRLKVEVEADTAQEAYQQQLIMDDNEFEVLECDYEVYLQDSAGGDTECIDDYDAD
jgi:hypothetical protein